MRKENFAARRRYAAGESKYMQVRILISLGILSLLMLTTAYSAAPSPAVTTPSAKPQPSNSSAATNTAAFSSQRLALLLPLTGKQQAAGIAVRDGFFAAALQQSATQRGTIDIFDTNESGVMDAYARATRSGATLVVGPLLKEDIDALIKNRALTINTLTLNTISSDREIPTTLIAQFALDPEDEARQVAQRAVAEQQLRAIVIAPKNEWGQRVQRAFTAELTGLGGSVTEAVNYDPSASEHVATMKSLMAAHKTNKGQTKENQPSATDSIRNDFDFIFMAAPVAQAKQIYPAIRYALANLNTPIYATSDSYALEGSNNDFEGLRFIDMPWIINRDRSTANLYVDMANHWGNSFRSRSRLYALGIDAYRLSERLNTSTTTISLPRGVTGQLSLDTSKRIHRQLDWARITNGQPQLISGATATQ